MVPTLIRRPNTVLASVEATVKRNRQRCEKPNNVILGCGDCSRAIDLSWHYSDSAIQVASCRLHGKIPFDLFSHESGTHREWGKRNRDAVNISKDYVTNF